MNPPPSRRSSPLSRDEVVETALALTRRVGLNGLTMRGLAAELRVSPMATYHYVANKDELVRVVAETITASWPRLEVGERPWEEVLRQHLLMIWESLVRYPGLAAHLTHRHSLGITAPTMDRIAGFFQAAGFPPKDAILAWAFAETYIFGRLGVDAELHDRADIPRVEGLGRRDYVEYGVDTVIEGLRARLRASQGAGT